MLKKSLHLASRNETYPRSHTYTHAHSNTKTHAVIQARMHTVSTKSQKTLHLLRRQANPDVSRRAGFAEENLSTSTKAVLRVTLSAFWDV